MESENALCTSSAAPWTLNGGTSELQATSRSVAMAQHSPLRVHTRTPTVDHRRRHRIPDRTGSRSLREVPEVRLRSRLRVHRIHMPACVGPQAAGEGVFARLLGRSGGTMKAGGATLDSPGSDFRAPSGCRRRAGGCLPIVHAMPIINACSIPSVAFRRLSTPPCASARVRPA